MSLQVNDFQWEQGKNDAEYIKLLESSRDEWKKIAQKAISKLKTLSKEQEPRVMTLEEVRKLPRGTLVWQEHRGVNQPRPRVVHCVTDEFIIYTDGGKWYFELDDYGTKFRLWTTEPSEMKRQAVKWE